MEDLYINTIDSDKKTCRICRSVKNMKDFGRSSCHKNGRRSDCLDCSRAASRAYYENHKDEARENLKKWQDKNRGYVNAYARNVRLEKDDFVYKNELRGDPATKRKTTRSDNQRIAGTLRNRVKDTLKGRRKCGSTIELLGCDVETFKSWLESHFTEGMSWINYGKGPDSWSIDHHYPCNSFDLANENDQRVCFHWTNMYPMWHTDNIKKYDTIPSGPRTPEQEKYLNEQKTIR